MGKETEHKQVSWNSGISGKEYDALNDGNAYLLGISQLDAEFDVLSNKDTRRNAGLVNKLSKQGQDKKASMQKLDDALEFLCKIADLKITRAGQPIAAKQAKSPIEELDDALDFLCKIADISITKQPEMVVQNSVELVPMMEVQLDENGDDSDWDEFVKERVAGCRPDKEKKKAAGKVRKFFRRLIGKK